jgi:hypothetical protein
LGPLRYPQEQITELSLRVVENHRAVLNEINRLKTLVRVSLQFIQPARFGVELLPAPPPSARGSSPFLVT